MKQLIGFFLTLCALISIASAQDLSADEVLANATEAAQALQDAQFLLVGTLLDPDGSELALEVQLSLIPSETLARADFFQPDALADNFVIFDDEAIYNYVFLTNQISIFKSDDPNAIGGLFPDSNVPEELDFNLDLEALFDGWDVSKEGYEDGYYRLKFSNSDDLAAVKYVVASVVDGSWEPYSFRFVGADEELIADLRLENFERDTGLDPEDVRYYPDDAEVIDER